MWRGLIIVLALIGAASADAGAQQSLPPCAPTATMTKLLEERHGEHLYATGEALAGAAVMEIYINPQSRQKSWTLVMVQVKTGISCIRAYGVKWRRNRR